MIFSFTILRDGTAAELRTFPSTLIWHVPQRPPPPPDSANLQQLLIASRISDAYAPNDSMSLTRDYVNTCRLSLTICIKLSQFPSSIVLSIQNLTYVGIHLCLVADSQTKEGL